MSKRKITCFVGCVLMLSMLAACSGQAPAAATTVQAASSATSANTATTVKTDSTTAGAVTTTTGTGGAAATGKTTVVVQSHIVDNAEAVQIVLNGKSISVNGDGATVDGRKVTITHAGTYNLSGSLNDGQVVVDTQDEAAVLLVLNGVDIHCATSAPIYIADANEVAIILADGAENAISDGDAYILEAESDEPNAAIFSKADLTIEGNGSLTVVANYNDGIASKDDLVITGGAITVKAVDDGIRGKDYLIVQGGEITVRVGGDGLKSDNEEDAAKGYVTVKDGILDITAGGDAITAQTDVLISGGQFTLSSGGGSGARIDETTSAKGIKGVARVEIAGGTFTIDSADDAIHSNTAIVIHGGTFDIATGDDAMHADATLEVNGGDFTITECYEGVESAVITINAGNFNIVASDDGLNVAGGNDGSGMMPGPGRGGRPGRGQDAFTTSSNQYLHINGGYIVIDAAGDGIDINGSVEMTDGVLIINGPTQNMNGPLDYDGTFKITGGTLLAVGSAGMAQSPDQSSTQYSVLLNLSSAVKASTLVHIETSKGEEILTFTPTKAYQSIAFSSPELAKGTYDLYFGGSSSGTESDGLYQGGAYSGGSKAGSFTISSIVTQLGGRTR